MQENFLLKSPLAGTLYEKYVRDLPIIDFHNHLSPEHLAQEMRYENLTQLWLAADPYKHRLMRISGIPERLITGDGGDWEKFCAFASVLPLCAGTPVFDWAKMELSMIFGIEEALNEESAEYIYKKAGEMLSQPDFTHNGILKRFSVEYQSPVVTLTEDLSVFTSPSVAPSLRGDDLLYPARELCEKLEALTGVEIHDTASYLAAVSRRLDAFSEKGCRFADHALDAGFFEGEEGEKKAEMLGLLAQEYAKRGFTLLLHLGAVRKTSARLARLAGPAGGYAAVGEGFELSRLVRLLGEMEDRGGLPDTVLFPLNLSDMPALAVMEGSFSQDGVPAKVQLGPAWWWCDHKMGIRYALDCISSFGVLSRFVGMTTDSRSVLSFVRHDYFRRVLCSYLAEKNEEEEWGLSEKELGKMLRMIAYENAKEKIQKKIGGDKK